MKEKLSGLSNMAELVGYEDDTKSYKSNAQSVGSTRSIGFMDLGFGNKKVKKKDTTDW